MFPPANNIEAFATPTTLFFDDLSILKKFDETNFIKLSLTLIVISFYRLFTNYFSVLCPFNATYISVAGTHGLIKELENESNQMVYFILIIRF